MVKKIQLAKRMIEQAERQDLGKIIFAYKDGNIIRMETENGEHPFVWRKETWREMRNG